MTLHHADPIVIVKRRIQDTRLVPGNIEPPLLSRQYRQRTDMTCLQHRLPLYTARYQIYQYPGMIRV